MITKQVSIVSLVAGVLLMSGAVNAVAQEREAKRYESGKEVYERICQACHMPDAKGAVGAGAYPPLATNRNLENALYPVVILLRGLKAMPAFPELNDAEIANVTNYIRANFGNRFSDAITVEQVKSLRPMAAERRGGRAG
jgi:mono/diheme cytochrome c family protein